MCGSRTAEEQNRTVGSSPLSGNHLQDARHWSVVTGGGRGRALRDHSGRNVSIWKLSFDANYNVRSDIQLRKLCENSRFRSSHYSEQRLPKNMRSQLIACRDNGDCVLSQTRTPSMAPVQLTPARTNARKCKCKRV